MFSFLLPNVCVFLRTPLKWARLTCLRYHEQFGNQFWSKDEWIVLKLVASRLQTRKKTRCRRRLARWNGAAEVWTSGARLSVDKRIQWTAYQTCNYKNALVPRICRRTYHWTLYTLKRLLVMDTSHFQWTPSWWHNRIGEMVSTCMRTTVSAV